MSSPVELDDADRRRIVDYADGRLRDVEARALEARLLGEPALAEALTEYVEGARLLTRAARARGGTTDSLETRELRPPTGRVLPLRRFALAAAILVALASALLLLEWPAKPRIEIEMAVLRTGTLLGDYAGTLGLDAATIPPGNRARDAEPASGALMPREFADRARAQEARIFAAAFDETPPAGADATRLEAAFGTPDKPVEVGYYVVAFRSPVECSAVVVALDRTGKVERLFPRMGAQPPRFPPGEHVLPARPVSLAPDSERTQSVTWDQGFMLAIGAERARVLLAVRAAGLTESDLAEIDRRCVAPSGQRWSDAELDRAADELAGVLRGQGFSVRSTDVRELPSGQ